MDKGILVLLALDYLYFLGCLLISALKEHLVNVDILALNLGGYVHKSLSKVNLLFVKFEDGLGIQLFLVLFDLLLDSFDIIDLLHDLVLLAILRLLHLHFVEESQEISLEVEALNVLAIKQVLKESLEFGDEVTPFL